jgi:hypothetical protein
MPFDETALAPQWKMSARTAQYRENNPIDRSNRAVAS